MNATALFYFSKRQLNKYDCFPAKTFSFSILKSLFYKYSPIHLPS